MLKDLILDLKTDSVKAFFTLFEISFHILGPKLVIVLVPKFVECIFPIGIYLLKVTKRNTRIRF